MLFIYNYGNDLKHEFLVIKEHGHEYVNINTCLWYELESHNNRVKSIEEDQIEEWR